MNGGSVECAVCSNEEGDAGGEGVVCSSKCDEITLGEDLTRRRGGWGGDATTRGRSWMSSGGGISGRVGDCGISGAALSVSVWRFHLEREEDVCVSCEGPCV